MTWILILGMWAGTMAKGDSVALTSVPGFATEQSCQEAGRRAVKEFSTMFKAVAFVCAKP